MLPILLATLLAALIIPVVRLLAIPGFRARIANPLLSVILPVFALALYLGALGVLALAAPVVLYTLAVLAVSVTLYLFWRARPAYGKSQGLPPGSLALFPTGPWADPSFYKTHFARHGPIFKTSNLYRPEVCILGIERSRRFLAAHADSIQTPAYPIGRFIPGGLLRFADPARHKETRPVFRSAIAPAVYLSHQASIENRIRGELAALAQASLTGLDGVHPKPYLDQTLRLVLIPLFFGIDTASTHYARLDGLLAAVAPHRIRHLPPHNVPKILDELMSLIRAAVEEGTAQSFAAELEHVHPGALHDPYFTFNLIFMFQLGRIDLVGLLQWLTKLLADNPEWAVKIHSAPAPADLATRIVLETLRMVQSEYLIRQATRDLKFEGYTIPKNWFVRICISESHREAEAFADPDTFNPDRFLDRHISRSEYMPFGALDKSCLGEHFTLLLAKLFVTELAVNYMTDRMSDAPPEYSGFHWQPSRKFRVRLLPYNTPAPEFFRANKLRSSSNPLQTSA